MARILACGAFLKNAACLLDTQAPDAVRWSANHGDLSDPTACQALEAAVAQLLAQADGPLDAVAHDLHPDFFSTQLALRIAGERGLPAFAVQHHHAHIATVAAEHGLRRPLLGLALDGVGLGDDGLAWGGEILRVDGAHYQRLGHLAPLALPGGDAAARAPWRMAAALLFYASAPGHIEPRLSPVVGETAARTVHTMLQRSLNCPQTTAAGRWFDAVAGLLGLNLRQEFEAQAAMALEQAAARQQLAGTSPAANPAHWRIGAAGEIDLRPWLQACLLPVDSRDPAAVDAAALGFHHTLAAALCQHTIALARALQLADVALGGGCFFNRILREAIVAQLQAADLNVLQTRALSCGDAGLALGQAWVAASMLQGGNGSMRPQNSERETTPCV